MAGSKKNQWTKTNWDLVPFDKLGREKRRERLFREAEFKCPNCGFDKRREDGKHVLEIDHIDGNPKNNTKENLRVLCPNCHALTPNFRNHGRSTAKTSSRIRRENKGFYEARRLMAEQEQAYIDDFRTTVVAAHESGEIDFAKFGWVQKLSDKINDPCPQAVSRRVKRLLPEFYANNCFRRGKKRLLKQ